MATEGVPRLPFWARGTSTEYEYDRAPGSFPDYHWKGIWSIDGDGRFSAERVVHGKVGAPGGGRWGLHQ